MAADSVSTAVSTVALPSVLARCVSPTLDACVEAASVAAETGAAARQAVCGAPSVRTQTSETHRAPIPIVDTVIEAATDAAIVPPDAVHADGTSIAVSALRPEPTVLAAAQPTTRRARVSEAPVFANALPTAIAASPLVSTVGTQASVLPRPPCLREKKHPRYRVGDAGTPNGTHAVYQSPWGRACIKACEETRTTARNL